MAQVKNLPPMQETWVQSLGHEDPLENRMATHSSILARVIPWTEEPGGPWGCKESNMMEQLSLFHRNFTQVFPIILQISVSCHLSPL